VEILISAGEASGDLYAASLVEFLRERLPEARFFGCAGPRMQAVGVEPVIDAAKLGVVGLVEVVRHIPEIYGEYRKLLREAERRRPALAILTDSPDFHLRVAAKLKRKGTPVEYLIAPQVWAWRKGRLKTLRRNIDELLCIFPFEEEFFRANGVPVRYIGHPLTRLVRPSMTKEAWRAKHGLAVDRPLAVLLPGSRAGESGRHLPCLAATVSRLHSEMPELQFVLATPAGLAARTGSQFFTQPFLNQSIQRDRTGGPGSPPLLVEGETWDAIAHADVALAASGTVTMECALLGTPMVTYYRVTRLSWWMGRFLVDVPFYTMVNLIARERVAPELIQNEMTAENLSRETLKLLRNPETARAMKAALGRVSASLDTGRHPMETAAEIVAGRLKAGWLEDDKHAR
jgi:lipid-A-disaccharide synthase